MSRSGQNKEAGAAGAVEGSAHAGGKGGAEGRVQRASGGMEDNDMALNAMLGLPAWHFRKNSALTFGEMFGYGNFVSRHSSTV